MSTVSISSDPFVSILFKVAKGARKDLGRPKEPPQVNKALYMKTLGSCEGKVVSCEL